MQQKNMATFGVPQRVEDDPEGEDKPSTKGHDEEEDEGMKTGRSQWTSLSKAREEKA